MAVRLRDITRRQLRALAAIASSGSVTSAAKHLHLTQPAVTLQLRNLQDLADLPLLQRTGDGMILTDAGIEMLQLHGRIEAAIADCEATLGIISGKTAGRVSIGAVSTAKYFVPFIIAAFSRAHPRIEVRLSIGNRAEIMQALRDYKLDVAITGRPPPDIEVEKHLIGQNPHVIIASRNHWLAKERGLAAVDLSHETFLTREPGSGTRMLMERLFEQTELAPHIGMEFDSNETIKQSVIADLGIAFLSAHTVATELEDGRLVTLDVAGLPVTRQWFVMRRVDKVLLPPAQEALDFIAREASQYLPRPRLSHD
ncbi:LysR family transcriptional regulator [Labrys sp. LIt4]|uniref:HTH-type transcriptional regulator CbbR n=1 Tax=Labrys okinawensis TaxID=346911 RepID=A0A2S9Q6M2_9HYPH|nr:MULTISPECIES: LysR family transcriptional regulator [Labrys]MBP0578850.1 LysR family transcriptional regulator [Labrys sp. LIt4]PRH84989.1 LysR family transcriptional regulator [Labrys okinawensis]